jgi:Cu+-exporting ATPase
MKNTLAFILLSTSLSIIACNNPTSPKVVTVETTQNMKADPLPMAEEAFGKLIIEGMTCAIGCAATIEKNLQKTTGVTFANVDFETKTAWVVYDAKHLNMEAISMVVKATGESYSVTKMERLNSIK